MNTENEMVRAFAALAHENRLAIFRLLVQAGPDGLTASAIAKAIESSPTSCSFHLKELSHAGLIHSWRNGRYVHYAVVFEGMRKVLAFLTDDCCGGKPELCGDLGRIGKNFCNNDETKEENFGKTSQKKN